MRTISVAIAALLLLALPSFAQYGGYQQGYGGGGGAQYAIKTIAPSVILSPEISFTFGPQHPQGQAQQWLEVEVDFESTVPWTDELTLKYYILFANKCLTGQVTHIDVPAGRDLYSVMYVSPKTLARLLNGAQLSPNAIQDVGVQIVKDGQVLTTKSYKPGDGQTQWWQNFPQINGVVLNKDQTPFAPLIWDRYEQVKIPNLNQ
jgi:hypothetical protein